MRKRSAAGFPSERIGGISQVDALVAPSRVQVSFVPKLSDGTVAAVWKGILMCIRAETDSDCTRAMHRIGGYDTTDFEGVNEKPCEINTYSYAC